MQALVTKHDKHYKYLSELFVLKVKPLFFPIAFAILR
jgi:hypothetical protein